MAIITKIEAQKKNTDRVNIYINDEFFMSVFTELVYTFNLKKGMEINKENLKTLLDDDMYIKAKNKALNLSLIHIYQVYLLFLILQHF